MDLSKTTEPKVTAPPLEKKSGPVVSEFSITLDQVQDYEFRVKFDKEEFDELRMDEPAPLGADRAPNASRFLAAALGNCLSASLLFCARKARVNLHGLHTMVKVQTVRNETGRLRIGNVDVEIDPQFDGTEPDKTLRCLEIFEDYCVVTQSVRNGLDVHVSVKGFDRTE